MAGLSFSVRPGELFAILGPNGAGKTTTVEVIEGYRRADDGEVRVLGLDPGRDEQALRARMGLMLQAGGIYPQARPAEILRLFARFYAAPHDPEELLDLVGLREAATTRYKVLSGGQKQRLGLALALVGRPELVVLDEPTAGMDPAAKATTRALIGELRAAGVTVLLTTHDLADVERLADRIALIDRGRLVALGSPAELTAGALPRLRFRLGTTLSEVDNRALDEVLMAATTGGSLLDEGGGRYRLDGVEPRPELIARLASWCGARGALIVELRTSGGTLEERYLELLAESAEGRTGRGRRWTRSDARRTLSMPRRPRIRRRDSGPRNERRRRRAGRPGDGRAASPAWRSTLAQAAMELRLTARRGENLLVTLVIPVVLLLFFGSVNVLPAGSGRPIDFLLPGILALAVISTSLVNLGIATAYERSYGVLKRLGGSPLPRGGLIAAKILAVLVVELVQAVLLIAIAVMAFGWAPGAGASPVVAVAALLLGTLAFAGLGMLMAGALRAEATLAGANGLYLVFLLLGGIVVPIGQLPAFLADIARVLPAAALSDAFRIGLGGASGDALGPLVVLAFWGVVTAGLAVRTFRWE